MEQERVREKQYGIHKIFKFIKKEKKSIQDDKSEIVVIEEKHMVTVVKVEFTLDCCFLLLSNGKVMSRAKGETISTLGRKENDREKKKLFEKIDFNELTKDGKEIEGELQIFDISAGNDHMLALDMNYSVWAWGKNTYRQVDPKGDGDNKLLPVKLNLPSDAKVVQIYALNNVSMVICKDNIIYMWGSTGEGFLGNFSEKFGKGECSWVDDYQRMDKVTNFIIGDSKKNDLNYTEIYLNSRKLFNTKYNQTLEDNNLKASRIQTLNGQINNYKQDIEERQRRNQNLINILNQKPTNKKIISLQELLKEYEDKLNRIIKNKDNLRRELIVIEEEISCKKDDISND
jgi:hypothetical protein